MGGFIVALLRASMTRGGDALADACCFPWSVGSGVVIGPEIAGTHLGGLSWRPIGLLDAEWLSLYSPINQFIRRISALDARSGWSNRQRMTIIGGLILDISC